jgi:8-oxo-dGTP pyrophosphatase MutT (NUDIX family)
VDPVPATGDDDPRSPEHLRRLVRDHRPRDAREAAAKEQFLSALERLETPCQRDADPVHVTASAVVVGERGTVLHLHRRLGRWMQPGGHLDPGEGTAAAARREAEEETGLAVTHPPTGPLLVHLDVHPAGGHTHLDLRYLLLGPDDDPHPPPGESQQARWFGWDEAEEMADEALVGGLRSARRVWERRASSWGAGNKVSS